MLPLKKTPPNEKARLHPRNKHRERYDFKQLLEVCPDLAPFVTLNIHQAETIDFANPQAVKLLNRALLLRHYGIEYWDIPAGYLCPPIPGRADYIHHIADLLAASNGGKLPPGNQIRCLDIGIGANCIYPILGNRIYGWSFIGSDIDPVAIESANKIIAANPGLPEAVECRLQTNPNAIFEGIIQPDEIIDVTLCNPPFHASEEDAQAGSLRKVKNLTGKKIKSPIRNFGGKQGELWCEGGEAVFLENMIQESQQFATSCFWFTSLVSKQSNLKRAQAALEKAGALAVRVIPMGQGNKTSRIVAWTFISKKKQGIWKGARWK
ncbi:MAG: 23S rRNA (adenine(1618)-N(6))-methyltransferase RlmF [Lewinellaceae bacterium]|nr:23S rRNA (adenine(1618)-N(6))-methyltransferase RlmF [Lewinellaceae bacterium]